MSLLVLNLVLRGEHLCTLSFSLADHLPFSVELQLPQFFPFVVALDQRQIAQGCVWAQARFRPSCLLLEMGLIAALFRLRSLVGVPLVVEKKYQKHIAERAKGTKDSNA